MKKIILMCVGLFTLFSCVDDDDNIPTEKKNAFDENVEHNLDTLQLNVLYKLIDQPQDSLVMKLKKQNVEYNYNVDTYYGDTLSLYYYAKNPYSPFDEFKVEVEQTSIVKYENNLPQSIERGISKIKISAVDKNREILRPQRFTEEGKYIDSVNSKVHKFFKFSYDRLNKLSPKQKPYTYYLFNETLYPVYQEYLTGGYTEFIDQVIHNDRKKVDAEIIWNNNPNATLETSTKSANTPIMIAHFGSISKISDDKGFYIILKSNLPSDYYRLAF